MLLYGVLLSPFIGLGLYWLWNRWSDQRRRLRRERLVQQAFPALWRDYLREDFHLYVKLPPPLRTKLEGLINIFIDEKVFLGRNGFDISDRVRVLVAAQACLLILNKPGRYYAGFETILVYPETYQAPVTHSDGWIRSEGVASRAGESWHRGPVILAWNQVLLGGRDSRDGYNVVMHEFAHKLDEENYHMDGLPVLDNPSQYREWGEILSREFEHLRDHRDEVIDAYGATSAAEFFAVVTEAFFEKAHQLKLKHPDLYEQFRQYYQLDPANW